MKLKPFIVAGVGLVAFLAVRAWRSARAGAASGSPALPAAGPGSNPLASVDSIDIAPQVIINNVDAPYVEAWQYSGKAQTLGRVASLQGGGLLPMQTIGLAITPGFLIKAIGRYATTSPGYLYTPSSPKDGTFDPIVGWGAKAIITPSDWIQVLVPDGSPFTLPEAIGYPNSSTAYP